VLFLIVLFAYPIIMFFIVRTATKKPEFLKKTETEQKSQKRALVAGSVMGFFLLIVGEYLRNQSRKPK
jgi:hypothetical protein